MPINLVMILRVEPVWGIWAITESENPKFLSAPQPCFCDTGGTARPEPAPWPGDGTHSEEKPGSSTVQPHLSQGEKFLSILANPAKPSSGWGPSAASLSQVYKWSLSKELNPLSIHPTSTCWRRFSEEKHLLHSHIWEKKNHLHISYKDQNILYAQGSTLYILYA